MQVVRRWSQGRHSAVQDMDIWVMKSLKNPSALGSKMLWNFCVFQAIVELVAHVLSLLMPSRGYDAISVLQTKFTSFPATVDANGGSAIAPCNTF